MCSTSRLVSNCDDPIGVETCSLLKSTNVDVFDVLFILSSILGANNFFTEEMSANKIGINNFKLPLFKKGKGLPQQADVVQGVPGRLRPRIFLTFGTTRVVVRQPYAPAVLTPGEIPGTHF